jgi:hypothetical protein
VRQRHDHHTGRCARIGSVDNDDATVLPLPKAPDAIELRHLRAFIAVAEELKGWGWASASCRPQGGQAGAFARRFSPAGRSAARR